MNVLGRLDGEYKATIKQMPDGGYMLFSKGIRLAEGPSARELANWAFDCGAQSVVFDFDLKSMEVMP